MRRHIWGIALVAAWLAAPAAAAQPSAQPDRYAIAATVGDSLGITYARMQTGSRIDQNRRHSLPLPDGGLTGEVALTAGRALRRVCETCTAAYLRVNARPAEGDSAAEAQLVEQLRAAAAQAGAGRIMLLTPASGEPLLKVADGSIGHGRVTGLGFYVDRETRMQRADTREVGSGFLAPYAYVRLRVFSATDGALLLDEQLRGGRAIAATGNASGDPWQAVPDDRKISLLLSLLQGELLRVLPRLP